MPSEGVRGRTMNDPDHDNPDRSITYSKPIFLPDQGAKLTATMAGAASSLNPGKTIHRPGQHLFSDDTRQQQREVDPRMGSHSHFDCTRSREEVLLYKVDWQIEIAKIANLNSAAGNQAPPLREKGIP